MDAQLLIRIVETYTKPGETILDQMAGSGTTMLACMLGRNVVLVELEERFVKMCQDNWEKVKMHHQLGYEMGTCQIIQGDARQLENILCDKIISSPPYESSVSDGKESPLVGGNEKKYGRWKKGTAKKISYTQSGEPCKVDNIITSPPYEGAMDGGSRHTKGGIPKRDKAMKRIGSYDTVNRANIGNLYKDSYLSAMLQVYQGCFSVLRAGGLMILVTKNFIRDRKEVRLDLDTIKLCEQAGFALKERWYRELPAQSFWRVLYHRKYPSAPQLKYEDILVFLKV